MRRAFVLVGCVGLVIQRNSRTFFEVDAAALVDFLEQGAPGGLHCEADSQWREVKGRLFFFLERLTQSGELDMSRSVNLLTRGVLPDDLKRCPMGAAAVQLFLQLTMAMADARSALDNLQREPWLSTQEEPWQDLVQIPWPLVLTSRWPIFQIMQSMRDVFLGFAKPPRDACVVLWDVLTDEQRSVFHNPSNAGHIMAMALRFPSDSCLAARVTTTLAMFESASVNEAPEMKDQLLHEAQKEGGNRWPVELLHSPWPALPMLERLERDFIPDSLRREFAGELRGALAYIHFNPKDMSRFHNIERSLSTLQEFWLDRVNEKWPVFIFVDHESVAAQSALLETKFPKLNLTFPVIHQRDLTWPITHEHAFCSQGYRRAARFTAGPLFMHEALRSFSHLVVIDTEFEFSHAIPWDPLVHMYELGGQLGYWQTHYERTWNRTVYLTEISKEFMAARNLQPQIPELVQYWWDIDEGHGGSFPVNIYGCMFAANLNFVRSELFQEYFNTLDSYPGWDEYCWSPQSVLAIAAGFFLYDGELVELWIYGQHQNSTKTPKEGWNKSRKGILPAVAVPKQADKETWSL